MTAADVLAAARTRLNDTAGTRYLAATLLADLNTAQRLLFSRRPDCVILETDETVRIEAPTPAEAETDVLGVHDRFLPALLNYVLYQAYSIDTDEHQATNPAGLAAFHRAAFESDAMTL